MMPGAGDCDFPELAYDSEPDQDRDERDHPDHEERPELRLTRQDAGRYQGSLFQGTTPGKANAELLMWLAKLEGFATVDDLLEWQHHNRGRGVCVQGCGHRELVGLRDGCRVWCPRCGVHTVCSAKDIATGDTPGPVTKTPPSPPRPGNMGGEI